jgi:DNA-binding GntR family transcriptional regulator
MARPLKPVRAASKFQQVYNAVLERLEEGEGMYAPGEALPAASTLAAQFDVSTATVGRVMQVLIKEGWLARGGNGYPPRVRYRALNEGSR